MSFIFFNLRKVLPKNLAYAFSEPKDEQFNFEQIAKYFWKRDKAHSFQRLSNKTWADLDLNEIFMFVDRTHSKIGQQFLYDRLRTIPSDAMENVVHEKIIDQFTTNTIFRTVVQTELKRLNDREVFYIRSLFQDDHVKPPDWFAFAPWLSLASIGFLIGAYFNPLFLFGWMLVVGVNMGIHFWNKSNLNQYITSLPQLMILNRVARELFNTIELKSIDPNLEDSMKELDKIHLRMTYFQFESKIQGDIGVIAWFPLEILKIAFLFEPQLLFHVLDRLDSKRKEIGRIFQFVGQVDALVSIAALRNGVKNYCVPVIHEENKKLKVANVYHPLILNCVRNSIVVGEKSILLTGSYMSGKTSFIRTIAINAITGLTLNTCFADEFSLCRMKIFSAIRISDDLLNDKSYYFEEVLTIREMISASESGSANLFLLDEIFKGTNTIERIAAGKSVLSYLNKGNNIVFVSTHDIELADLLNNEYELYHFSELVDHQTVDFDYLLKPGKLKNRNAIRILQINNYPEEVTTEAMDIARQLDNLKTII
jgi:DNA mismatch repair ATPase MutS